MGSYFARHGYRLNVIAKPIHNPRVETEVARTRRACGFDILYTGEGLKPGLRHLRDGGILAIVADQDARQAGLPVPFFGVPASTALGPVVFARLAKAPILPVFPIRVGPTRHRCCCYPPIWPVTGESRLAAFERMTHAHVAALEDFIKKHPEQYFWFHRRWKTPAHKLRRIGGQAPEDAGTR
jgi:KDO2-lipid IV(A) lauroyltransferase